MRLKYKFLISTVAGRIIAVPDKNSGAEFNGYLVLNETGKVIFEALKQEIQFDEIISLLQEKFPDATVQELTDGANSFLKKLISESLVE